MLRSLCAFLCVFLASVLSAPGDQPSDPAEYAWSAANVRTALSVLAAAAGEGLDADRYHFGDPGDRRALTAAVLTYMQDVAAGRPDLQKLDTDIALPPHRLDAQALLTDALKSDRLAPMLAALPPSHPGYLALKTALAQEADPARREILAANMERWRWLPARLEPDRIEVNAASAELTMWLAGRPVLSSRVIVGKPATPTPILRA